MKKITSPKAKAKTEPKTASKASSSAVSKTASKSIINMDARPLRPEDLKDSEGSEEEFESDPEETEEPEEKAPTTEPIISKKSSGLFSTQTRYYKREETKKELGTVYECGSCRADVKLIGKETIMCKECGYRILFKKRINKKVEFLAR
jgi:DNA-directed RNA polymerase I, II, and III subunit RPABC4